MVNGKLVIPAILDQVIDISLNNNYMVTLEVINGPLEESTYNYNFSLVDTISKTITIVDEKGAVLESIDVSSKFGTDLEIELPSIEGFVPLEGDYKYIVDFNSADDITITYREVIKLPVTPIVPADPVEPETELPTEPEEELPLEPEVELPVKPEVPEEPKVDNPDLYESVKNDLDKPKEEAPVVDNGSINDNPNNVELDNQEQSKVDNVNKTKTPNTAIGDSSVYYVLVIILALWVLTKTGYKEKLN
ncbi:MAG: hypothetical protein GX074_00115 [Erysipelothrix sp.]|nr:hypothetical protein [Erysipelothrix sp.]